MSGTKEMGIVLRPDDDLSLEAHIDASYGVHEDGKSHSGMHLSLGLGAFFVKSSKQKIVTKSSTEAELYVQHCIMESRIFDSTRLRYASS